MGEDRLQLLAARFQQFTARVVDQQAVFQIQTECAWIEVIAGQQGVAVIHPHTFEVVGVVTFAPQMQVKQAIVDHPLMALGKPAQAHFIQVRQRRDNPEWLARRDIEVVGGLVTDHDINAHPTLQGAIDFPGNRQGQVEIRRADGQLLLAAGNQFANHPAQLIILAYPQQRADRQAKVADRSGAGVVAGFFQVAAKIPDGAAQAAGGRQCGQVETMHGLAGDQVVFDKTLHGVGQLLVVQQVVTVEAILVELVQVHVVQAGAAVDHTVVDNEALEVQHPEQFPGLYRHTINGYLGRVCCGLCLVPGRVAGLFAGTDQPALGAQPVNHHGNLQLGACSLGRVQGIEDFLPGFVLLQVQGHQRDAMACTCNVLQQAATKVRRAGQDA